MDFLLVGEQPSTESSSFNLSREFPYKLSPLESLAIHSMFHGFDSIHWFVRSFVRSFGTGETS